MREILLRLRTVQYEKARELAEAVRERADRTLKTARNLGGELRGALDRARDLEGRGSGRRKGGGGGAGDERDVRKAIGAVNEGRERAESVLGAVSRGSLPSLMTAARTLLPGIGGPLLLLFAPVAELIMSELERRFEAKLRAREAAFMARFERERLDSDYSQRLAQDPQFRRAQARLALDDLLAEEARGGRRIEPSVADLVTDFGL